MRNGMKVYAVMGIALCLFLTVHIRVVEAGSLWVKSKGSLFTDYKARHVGDIVTILIEESSESSSKATTKTDQKTSHKGGVTSIFFPKTASSLGVHKGELPAWDWGSGRSFSGGGSISRDGELKATITAVVKEVLPNGNLFIEGHRKVTMSGEVYNILVSGVVRPRDITAANTVSSSYIADAEIRYEGKGPLRDNQRRGFVTRLVDFIWPF